MIFSHVRTQPGEVTSISLKTNYVAQPLPLFHQLTKQSKNSLLLESSEIESKTNLNSMLLIDAAMKITCHGHTVRLEASSNNGLSLVPFLAEKLKSHITKTELCAIEVTFAKPDPLLN